MDGDMVSLNGAAIIAVTSLLSAMGLAIIALWRNSLASKVDVIAAKDQTITLLVRELALSQQREEAWKMAAFDSLPIMQKQSEVAVEAFGLAKRRGAA